MKKFNREKGFIEIVIVFIIALCFAIAAVITLFWSKAPLSVSHLKRFQAINYTEAALYETFSRFRSSVPPFDEWDASQWALWIDTGGASGFVPTSSTTGIYTLLDTTDTSVYPAGQPIVRISVPSHSVDTKIDVAANDMGTPADASDDRDEVMATLDQELIKL